MMTHGSIMILRSGRDEGRGGLRETFSVELGSD
jgi:hypothetical protein